MRRRPSPWLLQLLVALGGVVPVAAGLAGIWQGPAMLGDTSGALLLDSHFRYLSGLLLAIGLGFWSTIPHIRRQGGRFRLLTFLVVLGGVGRAFGLLMLGVPGRPMLLALIMELGVTPVLCLWQATVASARE